jgi:hypothetical protein
MATAKEWQACGMARFAAPAAGSRGYATIDTCREAAGLPVHAVYELPAARVFTLYAMAGAQPLRITRVADLWALDARWPTTTGDPQRCSFDAGRVGTVTIYPSPASGGTLGQVCQETPATIQAGASAVALPTVVQDYFSYAMLAAARGKESEARMEEMARHFGERLRLYEQVIAQLWGPGQ